MRPFDSPIVNPNRSPRLTSTMTVGIALASIDSILERCERCERKNSIGSVQPKYSERRYHWRARGPRATPLDGGML